MAKGGLATVGGFVALVSGTAALIYLLNHYKIKNTKIEDYAVPFAIPTCIVPIFITMALEKINGSKLGSEFEERNILQSIIAVNALAYFAAAYKIFPYSIKTLKAGWNYKEYLQTMLANLDAIDAYITQAKV